MAEAQAPAVQEGREALKQEDEQRLGWGSVPGSRAPCKIRRQASPRGGGGRGWGRADALPVTWLRKAGSRKRLRIERETEMSQRIERGWQRADDAHTVANPQTFQVENVSLTWGPTSPLPKIKAAGVTGSMNVRSAL